MSPWSTMRACDRALYRALYKAFKQASAGGITVVKYEGQLGHSQDLQCEGDCQVDIELCILT